VSAELSEDLVGWDGIRNALGEICASREEFERFFSEALDQLDSFSTELVGRQQQWVSERRQAEIELQQQKRQLEEARASLAGQQQSAEKANRSRRPQKTAPEAEHGQQDQQHDQELTRLLEEARQQQALLEQERGLLESELEAVRNRAAEMAESLAEQKRQTAQQHTQWTDEFKQMRSLLQNISGHLVQRKAAAGVPQSRPAEPATADAVAKSPPAATDPALDSVMAQFEMLQKDLAKRRAAN